MLYYIIYYIEKPKVWKEREKKTCVDLLKNEEKETREINFIWIILACLLKSSFFSIFIDCILYCIYYNYNLTIFVVFFYIFIFV